jgi:hypothetical protein
MDPPSSRRSRCADGCAWGLHFSYRAVRLRCSSMWPNTHRHEAICATCGPMDRQLGNVVGSSSVRRTRARAAWTLLHASDNTVVVRSCVWDDPPIAADDQENPIFRKKAQCLRSSIAPTDPCSCKPMDSRRNGVCSSQLIWRTRKKAWRGGRHCHREHEVVNTRPCRIGTLEGKPLNT